MQEVARDGQSPLAATHDLPPLVPATPTPWIDADVAVHHLVDALACRQDGKARR